jgi:hypothetical protein
MDRPDSFLARRTAPNTEINRDLPVLTPTLDRLMGPAEEMQGRGARCAGGNDMVQHYQLRGT